jgi:5'-nucleotidase
VQVTHERVEITAEIEDDAETAAIVDSYSFKLKSMLEEEAGPVATPLDGRFQVVRTMECNLGNLVADIVRHSLNGISDRPLDCTFINGGTLRSDMVHKQGNLKKRDLLSILPMMDEVAVVEITGKDLLRALEVGVSMFPKLEGRWLHVRPQSHSTCLRIGAHRVSMSLIALAGFKHFLRLQSTKASVGACNSRLRACG